MLDISDRKELISHEDSIRGLFYHSFGRAISSEVWRWFYVDNPSGSSYVSLCYENDQLIGHYAAIPLMLSESSSPVRAYLSMTTMIHPLGRGRGLFTDLANDVVRN